MTEVSAADRRLRRTVLVALLAGALCAPLVAAPESSTAALPSVANAQRFFSARFRNHILSRNLRDPDRAFWVGDGSIHRLSYGSPATVCCSSD